ncbi:MAG: GAF domain-containing protein, partial [Chloroflexi bacterium]|nr:GAF domain-containing protein [Chloroflexota bacterium]
MTRLPTLVRAVLAYPFSSVRRSLLVLVVLAVVPALALLLYTASEERRLETVEAQTNALRLARLASQEHQRLVEETHQLLDVLAQLPEIRDVNQGVRNALLARLRQHYPIYANLGILNLEGDLVASAIPVDRPVNASDRSYFRDAVARSDFSVGSFQIGRVTGKATLSFASPIFDNGGKIQSVVFAALDLTWLNQLGGEAPLPPGSTLAVVDRNGTLLARYPDGEKWAGKSVSDAAVIKAMSSDRAGVTEARGVDDVQRIYAFTSLAGVPSNDAVYILVGIPKEAALGNANQVLIRNLVTLGFVGLLALLVAWVGSDFFVLRPLGALVKATKRLSAGDLTARTGLNYKRGELSHLARGFDEMADSLQRHHEQTQALARVGAALNRELEPVSVFEAICQEALTVFKADAATVMQIDPVTNAPRFMAGRGFSPQYVSTGALLFPIIRQQKAQIQAGVIFDDVVAAVPQRAPHYLREGLKSALCAVMFEKERPLGALAVFKKTNSVPFCPEDSSLAVTFAEQAAVAVVKARHYADSRRQLKLLQALHDIDTSIASSHHLSPILRVFLEKAVALLKVDAADVLLLNPQTQVIRYAAGSGLHTHALRHTHLKLGEGHAGRAALKKEIVRIANLSETPGEISRSPLLEKEQFVTYYAAPLIAKGQVRGVLEIFHRSPFVPSEDWLDTAQLLAGQLAIAIDNASLFDGLQRSHDELALAYDTTLEGWSRALDLRDKETEGHTQRVAEVTLRLAREMGVSGDYLLHIRRGALLHDIGKMGIPDSILLKPGPLSEEEWEIMRLHPVYAYQLLSPISHLQPALDIPYYHHEKWDGTGYPRGLRGEQIPIAARIFAVVDVWDAL